MKKIAAIALTGAVFELGILAVPATAQTITAATEAAPAQAGRLKGKVVRSGDNGMIRARGFGYPIKRNRGVKALIPAGEALAAPHVLEKQNGGRQAAIPAAAVPLTAPELAAVAHAQPGDSKTDVARKHKGKPAKKSTGAGKASLAEFH